MCRGSSILARLVAKLKTSEVDVLMQHGQSGGVVAEPNPYIFRLRGFVTLRTSFPEVRARCCGWRMPLHLPWRDFFRAITQRLICSEPSGIHRDGIQIARQSTLRVGRDRKFLRHVARQPVAAAARHCMDASQHRRQNSPQCPSQYSVAMPNLRLRSLPQRHCAEAERGQVHDPLLCLLTLLGDVSQSCAVDREQLGAREHRGATDGRHAAGKEALSSPLLSRGARLSHLDAKYFLFRFLNAIAESKCGYSS
jgi:hypothetical protein